MDENLSAFKATEDSSLEGHQLEAQNASTSQSNQIKNKNDNARKIKELNEVFFAKTKDYLQSELELTLDDYALLERMNLKTVEVTDLRFKFFYCFKKSRKFKNLFAMKLICFKLLKFY